jgi:hypothetical protein
MLKDLARRDTAKADLLRPPGATAAERPAPLERSSAPTRPAQGKARPAEADEGPRTIPFAEAQRRAGRHSRSAPAPRSSVSFNEFTNFDDSTLLRVFAAADPQSALLALVGATPQLVNRLMRRLSRKEAAQLQRRMESLGPFRLQDVELAQEELAQIAGRIAPRQRRAA